MTKMSNSNCFKNSVELRSIFGKSIERLPNIFLANNVLKFFFTKS